MSDTDPIQYDAEDFKFGDMDDDDAYDVDDFEFDEDEPQEGE